MGLKTKSASLSGLRQKDERGEKRRAAMITKVPADKISKDLTLTCVRCQRVLRQAEPGFSRWRYDYENDQVLCPECISDLKERELDQALKEVFAFINGARWALRLTEFYDEKNNTESPPHIEQELKEKLKEMIFEAVRKVESKYGER